MLLLRIQGAGATGVTDVQMEPSPFPPPMREGAHGRGKNLRDILPRVALADSLTRGYFPRPRWGRHNAAICAEIELGAMPGCAYFNLSPGTEPG
jgi:hypothetical protein